MKILATADIHGSQHRLNILLKNVERYSPDLVVICGDITQFGPGELARNFLEQIPIETLAVTGNIDTKDVSKSINDSNAVNIEGKKVIKKGIAFIGINGVDSEQMRIALEKKLIDNTSILVSHEPPYGAQDKAFLGKHQGNQDLRGIIEKYRPRLVLCGHIHEDPGFSSINETIVVNCSMGKRGEGSLIEINEKIKVRMLD